METHTAACRGQQVHGNLREAASCATISHISRILHPPPCLAVQALRQMGLEGVLVLDVPPGTPADKAGLKVGDLLISFGPHWLFSTADLASALSDSEHGMSVLAIVKRGGQTIQIPVVPESVH